MDAIIESINEIARTAKSPETVRKLRALKVQVTKQFGWKAIKGKVRELTIPGRATNPPRFLKDISKEVVEILKNSPKTKVNFTLTCIMERAGMGPDVIHFNLSAKKVLSNIGEMYSKARS